MGPDDIRLRQLSRMLGRQVPPPIRQDDAVMLGDAIFEEAANSDDVTGASGAAAYLAARIAFFGDALPESAVSEIRQRFTERWDSWEQV